MQLELNENEINAILAILGEMPIKSGTWPLMIKIKAQADAQLVKPEESEQAEEKAIEAING